MGASVGLGTCGLYGLACYFWGWPWGWEAAAALWLACFGSIPALGGLSEWLALVVGAFARGFLAADDDRPEDVAADPAPRTSPLVGGGLLDSWEQYHYNGLLLFLDHAEAANSLTSTALVPAAFTDGKHWGYWAGVLAASQLCVKSNGVATTLPQGRTWAWAKRQVRNGLFETPEDLGAAPPPPPHPFREGLIYNLKPEKAGKGGQKVERDEDD